MKGKENRGGSRPGAGRRPGPQPHLQDPDARRNRVTVSLSDRELRRLQRRAWQQGTPLASLLYRYAKKGGNF